MKLTKSYLESISTEELFQLANEMDLYLPYELNRQLIIGEILEFSMDQKDEPSFLFEGEITETPSMPQLYNITEIHALFRDPIWLFVFWDIYGQLFKTIKESSDFISFFLRVHSFDKEDLLKPVDFFDIDVPPNDRKRYIHLPLTEAANRIDLCCRMINQEQILAQSEVIAVPRFLIEQRLCVSENTSEKIISLSGLKTLKKSHFNTYRQAFR
ncbi:DUF4912 domain-containing protein [Treponema phagedenis]|uniref:DUF4912 domain-containing protein n=1 Tax=Treponema phagedenis TaxID=162 RepID=UPI0011E6CC3A|nr:DUF4912 domain-containing protein [Treponema phagedenis]QEJ94605.1 DUF4912 domain-containing protein [Treponema phagedenis]